LENAIYEIETRLWFSSQDELLNKVSFFEPCLTHKERWITTFYGLELFKSGKLLRIAEINSMQKTRFFLGWKGMDIGNFANIREELQEEITKGISKSTILTHFRGKHSVESREGVALELSRLGHNPFMDYAGENVIGFYQPLGLHVKIMSCPALKYPLLLEIEKTARTKEDSLAAEIELQNFINAYDLQQRVVKNEPPSLLYSVVFKIL